MTWTDGAVVAVENTAPANSKSLVSKAVVGTAVIGDTTQELVPNQEKDQRKMMQAQANKELQKEANQVVANKCQANQVVANKCQGNQVVANKCQANQVLAKEDLGNKEVDN